MSSLIIATKFQLIDLQSSSLTNKPDVKIFKEMNKLIPGSWMVDRTGSLKLPFDTMLLEKNKIPNFDDVENLSLLDGCVKRVNQLKNQQQHIFFLWSGGIDSTAALSTFIISDFPVDQITVVCNHDSLRENYKFYKDFIRPKFQILSSEKLIQTLKYSSVPGLVISSEHGDLLHGQDFGMDMFKIFGSDYLKYPANKENIKKFFTVNQIDEESSECWYDLFDSISSHSPRKIATMYDWSWWIGYNWRWQWAGEKIKLRFDQDINFETFFCSKEMQKWSASHQQYDIKKLSDFKIDLKSIIKNFTNDDKYYKEKIKYPSRAFTYSGQAFSAIDSNNRRISSKDFSLFDYYNENNFINQWLNSR